MKVILLRSNNVILKVLAVLRTNWLAEQYIKENHYEFRKDICQYSKYQSSEFITIESI